jgi:hypothetical protein
VKSIQGTANYACQVQFPKPQMAFLPSALHRQVNARISDHHCLVLEISESGVTGRAEMSQVPDHLYLILSRFDVVVGSIVVQRDRGLLHLCFVKKLKPDSVNRLARMTSPFFTLESLDPKPYQLAKPFKRYARGQQRPVAPSEEA